MLNLQGNIAKVGGGTQEIRPKTRFRGASSAVSCLFFPSLAHGIACADINLIMKSSFLLLVCRNTQPNKALTSHCRDRCFVHDDFRHFSLIVLCSFECPLCNDEWACFCL